METGSFELQKGAFGKRMVLTGPWNDRLLAEAEGVAELEVNYAHGWSGDDLGFLSDLTQLVAFELTDWNIRDVSAIHRLRNLRRLKISTFCKSEIAFGSFPNLEDVSLEWRPKAKSLFECESLTRVFINKLAAPDLTRVLSLPRLAKLSLAGPRASSLGRVGAQSAPLEFLDIGAARKLGSLDGVEQFPRLHRLEVNGCPGISALDQLSALGGLETLHLCDDGNVSSFRPLQELTKLRELLFYGTTLVEDGGVGFLRSLGLEKVVFRDRKHYDATQAELSATGNP